MARPAPLSARPVVGRTWKSSITGSSADASGTGKAAASPSVDPAAVARLRELYNKDKTEYERELERIAREALAERKRKKEKEKEKEEMEIEVEREAETKSMKGEEESEMVRETVKVKPRLDRS